MKHPTLQQCRTKKYDSIIEFLVKNAPNIKLGDADRFAAEIADDYRELVEKARVIAVLAETKLGLNNNGAVKMEGERKCVQWALKQVSLEHCGWVCSPFSGGLESLYEQVDEENKDKVYEA